MKKPILCVDFDGVLHSYTSPWTNAETISDGPVPGAMRWLADAVKHFDVHIYSSRSKVAAGRIAMMEWIGEQATIEFGKEGAAGIFLGLTFAHEKPAAFLTIDDRAICFRGNWAELDPPALLNFKPWNKKT